MTKLETYREEFNKSFNDSKVIEENTRLHNTFTDICTSARSEEHRIWKANGKANPRTS